MKGYVLCILPLVILQPNTVTFGGEEMLIFSGQLAETLLTISEVWSKSQLNNNNNKSHFLCYQGEKIIDIYVDI